MAKKVKMKQVYAVGMDDTVYIVAKHSGIHPLIIHTDGITICTFKGDRKSYLRAEDVIAWHEREVKESNGESGSLEIARLVREHLEGIKNGTVEIEQ